MNRRLEARHKSQKIQRQCEGRPYRRRWFEFQQQSCHLLMLLLPFRRSRASAIQIHLLAGCWTPAQAVDYKIAFALARATLRSGVHRARTLPVSGLVCPLTSCWIGSQSIHHKVLCLCCRWCCYSFTCASLCVLGVIMMFRNNNVSKLNQFQ